MIRCCGVKALKLEPHMAEPSKFPKDSTRERGYDRMCKECKYTYNKARRLGELPTDVRKSSLSHRFLAALEISSEKALEVLKEEAKINDDGCWIWIRTAKIEGYGNFIVRTAKKPKDLPNFQVIHHYSYWLTTGKVPVETIHHKCANRSCYNPEHLEEATARENVGEMFARKAYEERIRILEARVAKLERINH